MSFTAPTLPLETYGEANIRLGKIEEAEGVTIHLAVESGSRAWGFPSPDSDNDVRFFYTRPLGAYVGLDTPDDFVERPIDGLWDVNGWDLGKALRLLVKGNATVAEWLSSPLIYREHGPFPYKLRDLIKRHASPASSARHYYGLSRKTYAADIKQTTGHDTRPVRLKAYLYAARGAAAIAWIARYDEVPPMALPALLSHDIVPADARQMLGELLIRKSTMGEVGMGQPLPALDCWIEEQIAWVVEKGFDKLPVDPAFKAEANHLLLEALGIA